MSASGNVRTTQVRSGDRSGTGAKIGTVTGILTIDKQLKFDSNGNIVASSTAIGGGTGGSGAWWPELTAPVSGDFAWINQGGASAAAAVGGFHINDPAQPTATNLRIFKRAAPATPYKIEIAFLPKLFPQNYHLCGFCFRESGTGEIITFQLTDQALLQQTRYDSPTAFNATVNTLSYHWTTPVWLRCGDDGSGGGSARTYEVSTDGQNWTLYVAESRTSFLTADEVGVFCQSQNSANPAGLTLIHWKVT